MKNIILFAILFAICPYANAKVINQIIYKINDDIITSYDISEQIHKKGISKNQAVDLLIKEILLKQELKKYNIKVSDNELNKQIQKIASKNNMGFDEFMRVIDNNPRYASFVDELKNQIAHRKLVEMLSSGNIAVASDEDLKIYYKNHKKQFRKTNKITGVLYSSTNERALVAQISNPMLRSNSISTKTIKANIKKLSPQLQYLALNTPAKSFTQIYQENGKLHTLFISKKTYSGVLPFKRIKSQIFEIVMLKRQNEFLKDYFDTLKAKANIKKLSNI